jgi:hypothetical protein
VIPVFSPVMHSSFGRLVDHDTTIEAVYDAESYSEMCTPRYAHYLAGAIVAPNVTFRIYPESLTYGVGQYDDAGMIAAYLDLEDQEAGIASTDDRILEWVDGTFAEIWEQSEPAAGYFRDCVRRYVGKQAPRDGSTPDGDE